MTTCPLCNKENKLADEDGATDGPREYHAACWIEIDENFRWDDSTNALYELQGNAYVHCLSSHMPVSLHEAHQMLQKIRAE